MAATFVIVVDQRRFAVDPLQAVPPQAGDLARSATCVPQDCVDHLVHTGEVSSGPTAALVGRGSAQKVDVRIELGDDMFGNGSADVVLGHVDRRDGVKAGIDGEPAGDVVHHSGLPSELQERTPASQQCSPVACRVVVPVLGAFSDAEVVHYGVHVRHRQPLRGVSLGAVSQRGRRDGRGVHGLPQLQNIGTRSAPVLLDEIPQPRLSHGSEVDHAVDGFVLPSPPRREAYQRAFPDVARGGVGAFEFRPGTSDVKEDVVENASGGSGEFGGEAGVKTQEGVEFLREAGHDAAHALGDEADSSVVALLKPI